MRSAASRFRGRGAAAHDDPRRLDVPAGRGAVGHVRADPRLGLYNTLPGLILANLILTLPFTVWVLTTFMRELPKELEEAAFVDGATPWIMVRRVFLPLMAPALVTTGLLAFIVAWNEFLFALTFTLTNEQRTVPVAIALITGASRLRAALGQDHGGLGHRDRAADRPGARLPAQDRGGPHGRRGQGLS